MSVNSSVIEIKQRVRIRGIALPNEHGSWGFLFEPLVASAAIAFSRAAGWIALLYIGAFLVRQPLKILIGDWTANRSLPQTAVAAKFTAGYGALFAAGLAGSLAFTPLNSFVPLVFIAPLGLFQIYSDVSRQSRALFPELTGAVAISSSAAVIALAGGWSPVNAYALWAVFAARLITSIIYVRNRLRLEKGKGFSVVAVIVAHLVAVAVVALLAANGLVPKLVTLIFIVLSFRAGWGLSPFRKKVRAMKIGIWEVVYGLLVVASLVLGHYLKL